MKPNTSLIKALDTLSLLSGRTDGWRLQELAEAMHLPRSTLVRTLATLVAYGLVEREGRKYGCGPRFDQWVRRDRYQDWIRRYRRVLEQVAKQTGELVLLGLHEGRGIVHIDYVESDQLVRVAPAPMTRHSLELTAQGKMVLSRRRDLFDPVTRPELKAELQEIQRSGVAWNREATVPGMIALATPGFTNYPTEPILAVAWPVNRFSEAKGEAAVQAIRAALLENRQRPGGSA